MPCTVTDADDTMERDSGISNNNESVAVNNETVTSNNASNNDLTSPASSGIEVDSVVTEAATATELVLQKAANTVAEELEAAASASMTSSAVTLETLSEDGSVIGGHHGVGSASMHHHQMHHHFRKVVRMSGSK